MIEFIKKYKWCKQMGFKHPIKVTLDRNFMRGCFLMVELKCPHCGSDDIRNDELICTDKNENIVILNYKGICSNCDKPVYWDEEFTFYQYTNIE